MTRRASLALGAATAAVLAAWAFFPVVLLAGHASARHAAFTGADGLIGADGVLGADQLQYLAWARSIAGHGLAADLFTLGRSAHVYLEPASGVVGGLLALGVPLLAGYLLVKALATLLLALGALAWVRRLLPGRPRAQVAAVALALFAVTPVTSLVNWTQLGSARFRFDVYLAGDELLSATKLWGYVPAALAIALFALCLLALERGLGAASATGAAPSGRPGASVALAVAAALGCTWLHPWQGITLALVLVAIAAIRRTPRELPALGAVLAAALLPLVLYAVLRHADPAWRIAAANESGSRLPVGVLALCVGPLLVGAGLGARRPGSELAEQALLLWIPAGLVTYLINGEFATHALEGLAFPSAVLAVRGAVRMRLPAAAAATAALLLTVPGLAYAARKFVRTARSGLVQYALPHDDAAALRWVHAAAPAGGVLAPTPFAAVIPSRTGRAVWVGHGDWSPDYRARARRADRLFEGRMGAPAARSFVRGTGARLLVADCAHSRSPARELGRLVAATHRFGCAEVIVLRPSGRRPRR
jgi:hypothetical protein